jgi:hypothetical protein
LLKIETPSARIIKAKGLRLSQSGETALSQQGEYQQESAVLAFFLHTKSIPATPAAQEQEVNGEPACAGFEFEMGNWFCCEEKSISLNGLFFQAGIPAIINIATSAINIITYDRMFIIFSSSLEFY